MDRYLFVEETSTLVMGTPVEIMECIQTLGLREVECYIFNSKGGEVGWNDFIKEYTDDWFSFVTMNTRMYEKGQKYG